MLFALRFVAALGYIGLVVESTKASSCSDGQYMCLYDGCIPSYYVCDGWINCPYGDDEDRCYFTTEDYSTNEGTEWSCNVDQYQCLTGECIPDRWVCDDYEDCPFGEDEDSCYSTDMTDETDVPSCPDGYQCAYDASCIPDSWVCDGILDCPVFADDEQNCTSPTTSPPHQLCKDTFDYLYDRCVLVDPFTATTWDEARYLCEKFGSDLVVLNDYNFYAELLQYIRNKGLDSHSYWVGATDREVEGEWRWVNSSLVPAKAPLWALYGCTGDYQVEPRPSDAPSQDCGFLDKDRGLYMSDASCDEVFATICQTPPNKNYTLNYVRH